MGKLTDHLLKTIKKVFYKAPKDKEELMAVLFDASQNQVISDDSLRMIEGVLQVADMHVRDVMIPRSQMVVVEHDAKAREILPIIIEPAHSRFPVLGENRDDVIGILLAKDLLRYAFSEHEEFTVKDIIRPAVFIPESKRLNVLLDEFRLKRNHIAIVVDEYGSVSGIVTIEDVLEEIVGEIEDEYDIESSEPDIKKLNDYQYIVKTLVTIEDFNEQFNTNFSDEEFYTIGGLATHYFGHVPKRGETVLIDNIQFKVLHADKRHVRILRITLPKK